MTEDYKVFLHTAPKSHLESLLKDSAKARDASSGTIDFEKIHYILTSPDIKNKPSINLLGSFAGNICLSANVEQINFLMTSPELSENLVMKNNYGLIGAAQSDNVEVIKYLIEKKPDLDLYKLAHNNKNELLYICVQCGSLKIIEYLCFEYNSENKMLKNALELCVDDNSVYLNLLKNPKFPKNLFSADELFKSAVDSEVFKYLIAEYNYDLTEKDIPKLLNHLCTNDGNAIVYLLMREDLQSKYNIHMNDDIIFKKLMEIENMEIIEELIFSHRLQLTPIIQENMDDVIGSMFKTRDICDMKEKLEAKLPETKSTSLKKI